MVGPSPASVEHAPPRRGGSAPPRGRARSRRGCPSPGAGARRDRPPGSGRAGGCRAARAWPARRAWGRGRRSPPGDPPRQPCARATRRAPVRSPAPASPARRCAEPPPHLLRVALVRRLLDRPAFLARPLEPAGVAQPALELVGERAEVLDVLAGVAELLGGERPGVPAGEGGRLREADLEHVMEQPGVAGLGGEAGEAGRHLRVEDVGERGPPGAAEDRHVLAARVQHDLDRRVGKHRRQRRGIAEVVLDRVEQHDLVADRDLHEAEQRPVAALGKELRVDAEPALLAGACGDAFELRHRAPSPSAESPSRPPCRQPRTRVRRRPSVRARRSRHGAAARRGTR